MDFAELEKKLTQIIGELEPVPAEPIETDPYELITFDRNEADNTKWLALVNEALEKAESFEIHCWNEETHWIEFALNYGSLKESNWKYGKIISGKVTPEFKAMILNRPKPTDTEIDNKMTPFFNVFLDDIFQSSHYGTEIYAKTEILP